MRAVDLGLAGFIEDHVAGSVEEQPVRHHQRRRPRAGIRDLLVEAGVLGGHRVRTRGQVSR
ncbi:hypothetical protein Vlu01_54420 [Micromonospora lutea]|uniref:Uncharacterized protein n=1 Tax=Micromonospora lutea TaxID=419825 RepID=A0ABQ4J3S2_9ACTN|nr:hypothetical protein [Micromonospora lutea]GIJ24818.1 hypothetical protein Vlu01_54420 [Micromonospora lutea]